MVIVFHTNILPDLIGFAKSSQEEEKIIKGQVNQCQTPEVKTETQLVKYRFIYELSVFIKDKLMMNKITTKIKRTYGHPINITDHLSCPKYDWICPKYN